jgi:hypothetical protein
MKTEQEGLLKKLFASVAKEALKRLQRKARFALSLCKSILTYLEKLQVLPSSMLYVARQEGFEEMAEELFQDVKQVASAYGALINNAKEAGKGRYYNI